MADNDKRWQDMTLDEQAVVIRQISGAVNGLQFRVQDLEEAVKALQRDGNPDGRASVRDRRPERSPRPPSSEAGASPSSGSAGNTWGP